MKQPNILYFVCHDLGRHLGCYGAQVESPNLDAFAGESLVFDNAFCNSPACSPSRGCALSGMYAHNSGGIGLSHMGWPLPQSVETITEFLGRAGYETVHSGVAHERLPETNHYEVELEEDWDDWQAHNAIGKAIDYLEKREDRSRPLYLNIGTQQVHASTWHLTDELHGGKVPPDDVWVPLYSRDTEKIRDQFGHFQASIRFLDQQWKLLMDALDRLDYSRDTLVIFNTDHGIANKRAKGTLYDRGTEIALLVRPPRDLAQPQGRRVEHLIQNIDYLPTVCEAAGTEIPAQAQGKSFWPLVRGDEAAYQPHEQIFIERNCHGESPLDPKPDSPEYEDVYDPVRSIRTDDFHFIRWFDPGIKPAPPLFWETGEEARPRVTEELYHTRLDPLETVNVADRPEYRDVKADLNQRLQNWMAETNDFALTGDVPVRPQEPGWGAWNVDE